MKFIRIAHNIKTHKNFWIIDNKYKIDENGTIYKYPDDDLTKEVFFSDWLFELSDELTGKNFFNTKNKRK